MLVAASCCPQQLPTLAGNFARECSFHWEHSFTDESFHVAVHQYCVEDDLIL
jgi:hypothetical protein